MKPIFCPKIEMCVTTVYIAFSFFGGVSPKKKKGWNFSLQKIQPNFHT
jgi:hypothetical protein